MKNEMRMDFLAIPENEAFARVAVGAFLLPLNPTLDEMEEIKTAVSEAVTNAIIHGYAGIERGMVRLQAFLTENALFSVDIIDCGHGIADIEQARQPLYTSCPNLERSGMGFTVMESFTDRLDIRSEIGRGTTVHMEKQLGLHP